MPSCRGCGAGIDARDKECPYCGESVIQRAEAKQSIIDNSEKTFGTQRDADGKTSIHFGDGRAGSRPSSGGGVASQYRYGAGSQGNVPSGGLDEKLDQIDRQLEEIPDPLKHRGSKDEGVALLDSVSAIGDLLSFYQSSSSHEAHLSTDDQDRRSMKEERIRPKLKSMVAFCERVESKTKKKMGLTDSDIRKIKITATKALQVTVSGNCPRCGTVNRSGTRQCQNCGAQL